MDRRLNADQSLASSDVYDAYGSLIAGSATDPFGYGGEAGYYRDAETGLYLCGHRYYDPQAARFLTRDPIGYAGGINLYGYVGGDPVNWTDPFGTDEIKIPLTPPGINVASLYYNMNAAANHPFILHPLWFINHVHTGGPWDYKQADPEKYADFGNFHFGMVSYAAGVPICFALRGAGWYQVMSHTSQPGWGAPPPLQDITWGGVPPFGDDPTDQIWIEQGYQWAKDHFKSKQKKVYFTPLF